MSKEAMKLALGELQAGFVGNAMQILREALAEQPAQKRPQNCGTGYCSCIECVMEPEQPIIKSYPEKDNSAQRKWVGLTDEEAQWLYDNCRTPSNLIDMTEAKLKELNQ